MITVTLWLLISAGAHDAHLVERFFSLEECQRVLTVIRGTFPATQSLRCIQAKVATP